MTNSYQAPKRSWFQKFRYALRGVCRGVHGQSSFVVHLIVAAAVIVAGIALGVSRIEWCLLALCITLVLMAETFNSALEAMAKAIDRQENRDLADGLDIGSGAVLIASLGAAITGSLIFFYRLGVMLAWWSGH